MCSWQGDRIWDKSLGAYRDMSAAERERQRIHKMAEAEKEKNRPPPLAMAQDFTRLEARAFLTALPRSLEALDPAMQEEVRRYAMSAVTNVFKHMKGQ